MMCWQAFLLISRLALNWFQMHSHSYPSEPQYNSCWIPIWRTIPVSSRFSLNPGLFTWKFLSQDLHCVCLCNLICSSVPQGNCRVNTTASTWCSVGAKPPLPGRCPPTWPRSMGMLRIRWGGLRQVGNPACSGCLGDVSYLCCSYKQPSMELSHPWYTRYIPAVHVIEEAWAKRE